MSATPWFKFYPSDWLAGTRGLTALEAGVYITLIAMMYDHASPLTMDEARLARMCGATPRQFAAALSRLLTEKKVIRTPEGGLWNARVASELHAREEKTCKAKEAVAARENRKTERNQGDNLSNDDRKMIERSSIPEARDQIPDKEKDTPIGVSGNGHDAKSLHAEVLKVAVETFNAMAAEAGLPLVQKLTDKRRGHLDARLKDCGGIVGWQVALKKVRESPFLTGENSNGWKADFDFLLQASSFTKLMEGSYDRKHNPRSASSGSHRGGFSLADAVDEIADRLAGGGGGEAL